MRQMMLITACLPAVALAGCATTSFSPPDVRLNYETVMEGEGFSCGPRTPAGKIDANVEGGRKLIGNFVLAYRCAAHEAANGRQFFEVPSFLALAGTAAAAAFGAGRDVPLAGGVASSLLNSGNAYYDPKGKADVYDSALDALLCIKTEAVGINALTIKKISAAEAQEGFALTTKMRDALGQAEPEVLVSAEKQYFDLVAAALLSVERVAAQRLSIAGKPFDAAGVMAQIKELSKEETEAESDQGGAEATAKALFGGQNKNLAAGEERQVTQTIIKLNALQPKLEQCVLRAKV
jgi:hypothetical protein